VRAQDHRFGELTFADLDLQHDHTIALPAAIAALFQSAGAGRARKHVLKSVPRGPILKIACLTNGRTDVFTTVHGAPPSLRPAPGKERALILDHAGNCYRFGLADAPREWSLAGRERQKNSAGEPVVCRCRECGALNPAVAMACKECGATLRTPRPRVEITSPALVEIGRNDRLRTMPYQQALRWAGGSEHRLRLVARARGFKPGWVWHRMQELTENDI
jgi:DNA repair protein RadD